MTLEESIILNKGYSEEELEQLVSSYLNAFNTVNQTSTALLNKYGKLVQKVEDYGAQSSSEALMTAFSYKSQLKVVNHVNFSSARKYSAVEFENLGWFIMGAPEYITKDENILNQVNEYAKSGLRVILLSKVDGVVKDDEPLPSSVHNVAMFVISDTIRPEVKDTMLWFRENDVDIKVISGDNIGYAVFGTPCQIYALNKFASQRNLRDNFLFVDLYCHGCPSIYVWTKYQQQMKEKYGVECFDHVNFRSKVRGWGTFNVVFEKGGKALFTNKARDDGFYELFFCDTILNEGCNDCMLRGTLEYTDIRLGDFWGKKYLGNRTGVSAVSVATESGAALFEKIKGSITYDECSYNECLPYQSWNLTHKPNPQLRGLLLESLMKEENSITVTVKILHQRQPMKRKLKRYVKNVLRHFPIRVINMIKRIVK